MRQIVIYTRVSTDEQALGYSLNRQDEVLRKAAEIHNVSIVAHFQEQHSGKDFNRPEYKKLFEFLKKNKRVVTELWFVRWDRFSRNVRLGLNMIDALLEMGVVPNAIEQPIDFSIPAQKMMLNIYLSTGEIENDIRSSNIRNGMRRAIKEGRWISKAPIGYNNSLDDNRKKIIIANKDAPLVAQAFQMMATNSYSQDEVRVTINKQGVKWTKSHFARILKNPVYAGYLILPATKEEPAEVIQGIHKPIIEMGLFNDVQAVLDGRLNKTTRPKKNSLNENLPLRGFLQCAVCGGKLTGSASRSKTGKRHNYYHCNNCHKQRIKAEVVNGKFSEWLKSLSVKDEIKLLYYETIKGLLKYSEDDKRKALRQIDMEIEKRKQRLEKIDADFADGVIEADSYSRMTSNFKKELEKLEWKKIETDQTQTTFNKYWKYGFTLISDIDKYYKQANVGVKQRLLGSILRQNLVFENNNYRTPVLNKAVELILNTSKGFSEIKTGQTPKKEDLSRQVELVGVEPTSG